MLMYRHQNSGQNLNIMIANAPPKMWKFTEIFESNKNYINITFTNKLRTLLIRGMLATILFRIFLPSCILLKIL
jgi:hypothetical protein